MTQDNIVSYDLTVEEAKTIWYACKCAVNHGTDEEIEKAQAIQSKVHDQAFGQHKE